MTHKPSCLSPRTSGRKKASTSETSVNFYETIRRNIQEDSNFCTRRCENLKSNLAIRKSSKWLRFLTWISVAESVGAPLAAGLSPPPSSICPRRPSRGCCCSSVPSFLGVVVMSTERLLWRAPIVLTHWNKWRHYRHHTQHCMPHTHSSLRHPDVINCTGNSLL
jgi:hypothetical protein